MIAHLQPHPEVDEAGLSQGTLSEGAHSEGASPIPGSHGPMRMHVRDRRAMLAAGDAYDRFLRVAVVTTNQARAWVRLANAKMETLLVVAPQKALVPLALPNEASYLRMAAEAVSAFNKRGGWGGAWRAGSPIYSAGLVQKGLRERS